MKSLFHLLIRILILFQRRRPEQPLSSESTVLVCAASGLGDLLMTFPMIDSLRKQFPGVRLSILTSEVPVSLLRLTDQFETVDVVPTRLASRDYWRLMNRLRAQRFTHFIGAMPCNTARQALIPFFAGIPNSIKHASPHHGVRNYDFLYTKIVPYSMSHHRRHCNIQLIEALGGSASDTDEIVTWINLPKSQNLDDDRVLWIAVHPGCRREAAFKRWPADRFASLINRLSRTGVRIVLLGGPDEMDDVDHVRRELRVEALDLAGRLDLVQTGAILQRCRCLISNDSGIMHLASVLLVPVIAIFGPTKESHIGPWSPGSRVVRRGQSVDDVTVDDVIETLAATKLLTSVIGHT